MNGVSMETPRRLSVIGCLSLTPAMFFLCLMPVFLFDTMQAALSRLHLSPTVALLSVLGIFLGSLVNIPRDFLTEAGQLRTVRAAVDLPDRGRNCYLEKA
jgi:uncharacterized membrane protein